MPSMEVRSFITSIAVASRLKCIGASSQAESVYFLENSDRNALIRWARNVAFGGPNQVQRHKFLWFRRFGTSDGYPLRDSEIQEFRRVFGEANVRLVFDEFVFFQLLYHFGLRKAWFKRFTTFLDVTTVKLFPGLMRYSYDQHVWMKKPIKGTEDGVQ